jgi:hypothetical protein
MSKTGNPANHSGVRAVNTLIEDMIGVSITNKEWSALKNRLSIGEDEEFGSSRKSVSVDRLESFLPLAGISLGLEENQEQALAFGLERSKVLEGTLEIFEKWFMHEHPIEILNAVYAAEGVQIRQDPFRQLVSTNGNWVIRKSRDAETLGEHDGWEVVSLESSFAEDNHVFKTIAEAREIVLGSDPQIGTRFRINSLTGTLTTLCSSAHLANWAPLMWNLKDQAVQHNVASDNCQTCGESIDGSYRWYDPVARVMLESVGEIFSA